MVMHGTANKRVEYGSWIVNLGVLVVARTPASTQMTRVKELSPRHKIVELIAAIHPVDSTNAIVPPRKQMRTSTGFHYVEQSKHIVGIQNVHKSLGPRRELVAIGLL